MPSTYVLTLGGRDLGANNRPIAAVGIIHNNSIVREGIRALLHRSDQFRVALESARPERLTEFDLQLVVLELNGTGIKNSLYLPPHVPRVYASMSAPDRTSILEAMTDPLVAFVDLDESGDLLKGCLSVLNSRSYLSPFLGLQVLKTLSDAAPNTRLTDRENAILAGLAHGQRSRQIGESMNLATSTIKNHIVKIYQKLGVRSRKEAVTIARARGLHVLHAD